MDLAKSDKYEFLEGWMLHGKKDVTLTIKGYISAGVFSPFTSKTTDEDQLLFEESAKKLILNKTRLKACVILFGSSETDNWIGRRIAVYSDWIKTGGRQTLSIFIRDTEPPPRKPTRRELKQQNGNDAPPPPSPPMSEAQVVQHAGDDLPF